MTAGELEAGIVGLDPAVLTPFYVDVLGFDHVATLDYPQGTVHRLRRLDARVKIFYPVPPARPRPPGTGWAEEGGFRYAALHLGSAAQVQALADAAVASHGGVLSPPTHYGPDKCIALVTDAEGNVLELIWEAS